MLGVLVSVALLGASLLAAEPPPAEVEARIKAGQSALAARQYAAAKKEFKAVLAADPANATAHISLGIVALVDGDSVAGLQHFSAVPGDARALIGRLDCELRLNKIAEARGTAVKLNAMIAGDAAASGHVGTLLAKAGESAAAIPFLRRVQGAAAANLLGSAEENAGNMLAALEAFAVAARLEPGNEDYRVDYAAMLLTNGNIEGSVAAFRAAAQEFTKSSRVRLGLGSALYLAGQHEAAAAALLEAVRIDPGPRAFDLLGKAYESAGALQQQIHVEFEKYLAPRPDDAAAYAHYAAILQADGGNPQNVMQALTRALELDPDLFSAHLQMGILEQAAGNLTAALERYERAAQLEPENATLHYRLSSLYKKLGNEEKARSELEKFRRLKR
ncbi:MAG TPA: tetratricopeptide repeat protein [Bryobacteraceae bacterium]|nr:tetratricopeptide repeat protein [Bryobacteraceae bacterium]